MLSSINRVFFFNIRIKNYKDSADLNGDPFDRERSANVKNSSMSFRV